MDLWACPWLTISISLSVCRSGWQTIPYVSLWKEHLKKLPAIPMDIHRGNRQVIQHKEEAICTLTPSYSTGRCLIWSTLIHSLIKQLMTTETPLYYPQVPTSSTFTGRRYLNVQDSPLAALFGICANFLQSICSPTVKTSWWRGSLGK
jgi:hypothetical protein